MARLIERRASFHDDAAPGRLALALALTAALSTGCSLDLSGLPQGTGGAGSTTTGSGMGGESGSTAVTVTSSVTSTGSVTSTSTASSSSTGTPCTPTGAEICNDGIDNDCDEKTDCEDSDCSSTGFVCMPAIPIGWTAVVFSAQDRPACPSGYEAPSDVVSAPAAETACSCKCMEQTAATCSKGIVGITSNGTSCPGVPTFFLDASDSSCGPTSLKTANMGKVKIPPLPPTQGTCSGTPQSTIAQPIQGRFCTASAAPGKGCADGGECVTNASAPFSSCVTHDGTMDCPAGFPKGHSVGSGANDTRSCSACTCEMNATCSNPKLTLYSDGSCTAGAHELPVTSACDPVNDGTGHSYKSYKYTAAVTNDTCQTTTSSMPLGNLVITGQRTVCCQ